MTRSSPFQAVILTTVAFGALCAGGGTAQAQFKQTNLVSDLSGLAAITDPNLVNPWGVSDLPGSEPVLDLEPGHRHLESVHGDRQHGRRAGKSPSPPRRTSRPSRHP